MITSHDIRRLHGIKDNVKERATVINRGKMVLRRGLPVVDFIIRTLCSPVQRLHKRPVLNIWGSIANLLSNAYCSISSWIYRAVRK